MVENVAAAVREYAAHARSTGTFGRVFSSCRNHHLVVDGPVENGCPGEAVTPAELFLAGVASCGVELLQVIARQLGIPLRGAATTIRGTVDRGHPVRSDVTVFNTVHLRFTLEGVDQEHGAMLVESFKAR
jgi:uncharacterized OsmC-like protein